MPQYNLYKPDLRKHFVHLSVRKLFQNLQNLKKKICSNFNKFHLYITGNTFYFGITIQTEKYLIYILITSKTHKEK